MFYSDNMNQIATYWAPGDPDGFGGVAFDAPVTIPCRWQDKAVLFRDANGQEQVSSSIVYVPMLVARRGFLFLGTSAETQPNLKGPAFREIRQVDQSPSLDGDSTLVKAYL